MRQCLTLFVYVIIWNVVWSSLLFTSTQCRAVKSGCFDTAKGIASHGYPADLKGVLNSSHSNKPHRVTLVFPFAQESVSACKQDREQSHTYQTTTKNGHSQPVTQLDPKRRPLASSHSLLPQQRANLAKGADSYHRLLFRRSKNRTHKPRMT